MLDYIKSWIPKIESFSIKLDKLSKIYNQPWVLIDDLNDFVKIIFREKGTLLVSKNGVVSNGSWELIHIANSIMLDISGEKRLYNHQFIDNGLMILKLDGHSTDFFVLANQNIIPDLDIESYLISKYSNPISQKKKTSSKSIYTKEQQLSDGRILQFLSDLGYATKPEVKISDRSVEDGFYILKGFDIAYKIENSKMLMEYVIEKFKQDDGQFIEVGGNRINGITEGSPVWLNGKLAPNGEYQKGWFSKIQVINGLINK